MESSRDPSPKIVTEIITENCGKSSPKIVTENHHRKQRAFSLPCQYHSGYWDYFCLTLDIFELFLISCLSPTPTFLTWHCKVEISFTPLAQYLCMITLDSALSLSGLRLAKQEQNDQFTVRTCGNVIGCPVYMSICMHSPAKIRQFPQFIALNLSIWSTGMQEYMTNTPRTHNKYIHHDYIMKYNDYKLQREYVMNTLL